MAPRAVLFAVLFAALAAGCVSRRLVITSAPSGAEVTLNHQVAGRTPLALPFTWHGFYEATFRLPGYRTKTVLWAVRPSLGRRFPVDLFTEGLGGALGDEVQPLHVKLEPEPPRTKAEILARVKEAEAELAAPATPTPQASPMAQPTKTPATRASRDRR